MHVDEHPLGLAAGLVDTSEQKRQCTRQFLAPGPGVIAERDPRLHAEPEVADDDLAPVVGLAPEREELRVLATRDRHHLGVAHLPAQDRLDLVADHPVRVAQLKQHVLGAGERREVVARIRGHQISCGIGRRGARK